MKYSLSSLIKDLLSRVWHLENDHISASRLSGIVSVDNLPDRSKNKILVVSNDTARFKLTKATVSEGDIIKVSSTKSTYVISDLNNLSNNNGYVELSVNNSVVADSLAKSIPDGSNNVDIIRTKMGTDLFRINVGTNGTDNGFVSFDMADNGDECIYFRQYGGAQTFNTILNQVTLLDGSGNTHFPHNVYATSFNGALNGNATSATKASTIVNNGAGNMVFHWSGQGGQPTWLFGSNDGVNAYVWNPSNFSVNYAKSAGNADTVDGWHRDDIRAWGNITGKPSTFTPSSHTHSWEQVSGAPVTATRWPSWGEVTGKPSNVIRVKSWDATNGVLTLESV